MGGTGMYDGYEGARQIAGGLGALGFEVRRHGEKVADAIRSVPETEAAHALGLRERRARLMEQAARVFARTYLDGTEDDLVSARADALLLMSSLDQDLAASAGTATLVELMRRANKMERRNLLFAGQVPSGLCIAPGHDPAQTSIYDTRTFVDAEYVDVEPLSVPFRVGRSTSQARR